MLYEGPDERPASDDQEATTVLTLAPVLGLQACGCCSEDAKEGMEDGEGVEGNKEMLGRVSDSSFPLINLNISTGKMREELVSCNFVCRLIFPAQN